MQQFIQEGCLLFKFPDNTIASKYDEWAFYRNQCNNVCGGTKAIDILHVDANKTAWFIEIKDYRAHRRTKPSDLSEEIALKVRDTLAGLAAARLNANDSEEKQTAKKILQASRLKVVFHLEQPRKHSKLFPRTVNPANIQLDLRSQLKAIDAHPLVVDQHNMKSEMDWTVEDISQT